MRAALALVLMLASGAAAALGLGQIQLKSKLGEPLLAEIMIVSSDPSELEGLRAGLASPETFARIGLDLPQGAVADLQFTPALNDAGRPVIRVTSVAPIEQPLLSFLVEVDWGQGRLVREYSTLMDAPRTLAASAQPSIQAPTQAPSNAIVRDAVAEQTRPSAAADVDAGDERPLEANDPVPAIPTPAQPASPPTRYGAVQSGEHLSKIAAGLEMDGNLQQRMIALLQANPDAFIGGNIHMLKQGAVLRIPAADEVAAITAAQAAAQVREQTSAWRVASQPVPQPQVADAAGDASQDPGDTAAAAPAVAPADGARLEIVPPGASDASRAGTQSGLSAGGEGDMVRQELQTTTETLAARDAELADLKSRIDTLEQLQSDQQKLLAMKDAELASAQEQLAQAQSAQSTAPADEAGGSAVPWLVGGTLLVLALVAVWWWRRRVDSVPRFRAPVAPASSTPAPGFAAGSAVGAAATADPEVNALTPNLAHPAAAMGKSAGDDLPDANPAVPSGREAASPSFAESPVPTSEDADLTAAAAATAPAWHGAAATAAGDEPPRSASAAIADASHDEPRPPAVRPSAPLGGDDAPGMERLELARAYLDLGDEDSARQLLGELEVSGSLEARQQATRLLRELG
ncbi:ferrous iron transporter B [Lysobacter ciconiae]|uniref:Ferrous iron transporter B n=1 Tax=Novilysobacter ciconiae TaxID=2781022 RepID=A0A7S6ZRJ9_9GAMM|nr:FimV/HubP family polar landmark protein [Lysobacter ciconiae]QOW18739.1 ferrous iron transporter B [Lysobacter ciconiae]